VRVLEADESIELGYPHRIMTLFADGFLCDCVRTRTALPPGEWHRNQHRITRTGIGIGIGPELSR
jgi:hypothetical protein